VTGYIFPCAPTSPINLGARDGRPPPPISNCIKPAQSTVPPPPRSLCHWFESTRLLSVPNPCHVVPSRRDLFPESLLYCYRDAPLLSIPPLFPGTPLIRTVYSAANPWLLGPLPSSDPSTTRPLVLLSAPDLPVFLQFLFLSSACCTPIFRFVTFQSHGTESENLFPAWKTVGFLYRTPFLPSCLLRSCCWFFQMSSL